MTMTILYTLNIPYFPGGWLKHMRARPSLFKEVTIIIIRSTDLADAIPFEPRI